MKLGVLDAIWRYPVKSLAAQALESTRIDVDGLPDDRTAALLVRHGHVRAGKPYRGKEHNLLHTTGDVAQALSLAAQAGVGAELVAQEGTRYFDDAPVSLVFDFWIAQVERALETRLDPRRWRPNLYARAQTDFDLSEQQLVGALIDIGNVVLRVRDVTKRCVTPSYDIESGEADPRVLYYVAQRRDNVMGVYCEVEFAGTVRVGDDLRLRAR